MYGGHNSSVRLSHVNGLKLKTKQFSCVKLYKKEIAKARKDQYNLQQQGNARGIMINYVDDVLSFEEITEIAKNSNIEKIFKKLNKKIQNKINEKSNLEFSEKMWKNIKKKNKINALKDECKIRYLRKTGIGFTFTQKNSTK